VPEGSADCQYCYRGLVEVSSPDTRSALALRRRLWSLKRGVWHLRVLGLSGFLTRSPRYSRVTRFLFRGKRGSDLKTGPGKLSLQAGDLVEVKSVDEIFATLDGQDKLRGLRFTPEMAKFCGRRFRVYKRLNKIIVEATGELRGIKTPTVLLDGVFCDGKAHGGCDRSCFCFWREDWLNKVDICGT
jgi:hypothetical protein